MQPDEPNNQVQPEQPSEAGGTPVIPTSAPSDTTTPQEDSQAPDQTPVQDDSTQPEVGADPGNASAEAADPDKDQSQAL